MKNVRRISILGSTGSIGENALDIVRHLKGRVKITALSARSNVRGLLKQIQEFRPKIVGLHEETAVYWLREQLKKMRIRCQVISGQQGLIEAACEKSAEMVLTSVVGAAGLVPTLRAIEK